MSEIEPAVIAFAAASSCLARFYVIDKRLVKAIGHDELKDRDVVFRVSKPK
jgi:hypothetical protein